jgi:uncharacterized membrane protein YcgQ (UPF0703/DUF1980 family)
MCCSARSPADQPQKRRSEMTAKKKSLAAQYMETLAKHGGNVQHPEVINHDYSKALRALYDFTEKFTGKKKEKQNER